MKPQTALPAGVRITRVAPAEANATPLRTLRARAERAADLQAMAERSERAYESRHSGCGDE